MIKIHCDGCEKHIERVEGAAVAAIKGAMQMLIYRGDPSNLRDPVMAFRRHSAIAFHWCDRCAEIAVKAIREANGK